MFAASPDGPHCVNNRLCRKLASRRDNRMSRLTFALLLTDEFTGVQQCRPRRAMN
ncbi:hypothetical protein LTSEADE_2964, partial [Salmonella enterica subsp. enterica serovar Adelaide str. A4-669]